MEGIKIHIGTTADTSGVNKTTDALKRADAAADEFVQSIKAGVGIDIGGRLVSSIASIPTLLQNAVSRGVEFNMTMQNAEVGISNVLAKFMDLDKAAAKREAGKAMQQLIELEPKTAGGLSDLVQGFLATVASAQAVGMSVEQNIDLVGKFANGLANANIDASQLSQEMRAIFTGNITPDAAFAKILEIDNATIEKAKEAGNLYQILTERIGSLGEAGDSANVRMSSFESARDKALGKLAEPISEAFLDGIKEITEALDNGNSEELEKLGYQLAELVKQGVSFTQWATQNTGVLLLMAKAVGGLVAAYAAFKLTTIISGLTGKARAVLANKTAIDAETASLATNTAAQRANAAARATGAAVPTRAATGRASNVAGAAGLGVGIGLIGYDALQSKAAEINAATAKSDDIGKAISEAGNGYGNLIKSAASLADKQAVVECLEKAIADLRARSVDATKEDSALIDTGISLLTRQLDIAKKIPEQKLKEAEAESAKNAEAKKAQEEKEANAEKDKKILDAAATRRFDQARDRTAANKLDQAQSLLEKGDISGAKSSLDEQDQYFRDYLAKAKSDQTGLSGEDLKANLDLQDQISGYLADIADARKDLPEAIAKAEADAKEKKIEALEEEKNLLLAQGEERLAATKEDFIARKQIEDELADKRLAIENQIGQLRGESALSAEARAAEARAQSITR
jgi:hypothetical protein